MVCNRLPRRMGLGRIVPLLGSRQRHAVSGAFAEFVIARARMAQRRVSRTRGKCSLLRSDRSNLDPVRQDPPTGKGSKAILTAFEKRNCGMHESAWLRS